MKTNHIVLLIDSLSTGGAQRQMVNLAIGIKNKGLIPLIVFYSNKNYFSDILNKNEIEFLHLKRKNSLDIFFFIRLLYLLKNRKTRTIIAFLFNPSGYALLLKLFLTDLQVIVSERSFEQKTRFREKLFPRMFYKYASYIIANSYTQTNVLKQKMPTLSAKIQFIPNGVIDQRMIYNYGKSDYTIVSIGRVSELKETKLLIKALANFKQFFSPYELKIIWIGAKFDSNEFDSNYFNECVTLIEEYELKDYWEWTGQTSNVNQILEKASLLVHMSKGEGFPNAICEAMSLGVPVVASNVMDHPYIIENNFNGYLVNSGDLNGLVNALNSFFKLLETERCEMSERAYLTALKSFSLNTMIDSYFKLLNSKN